ncbi:MAG: hypothetical protein ACPHEP_01715 [Acidimicrobiales bacterium]
MDTTRWKSIIVPKTMYEEVRDMAEAEGRTISGQLRFIFKWYKEALEEWQNQDNGA